MLNSTILHPCTSPLVVKTNDIHCSKCSPSHARPSTRFASRIRCCSRSNKAYIPKLEPFSRSKFDRIVKDPPLIQKSENELADYCSVLEGDKSYSCWRAYFELKDLEKERPKEDIERLILQAGGIKTLIGCLHGIASVQKITSDKNRLEKQANRETLLEKTTNKDTNINAQFSVREGSPKTVEDLEEEERGKMPDSPYTILLRAMGKLPAWFSPALDG